MEGRDRERKTDKQSLKFYTSDIGCILSTSLIRLRDWLDESQQGIYLLFPVKRCQAITLSAWHLPSVFRISVCMSFPLQSNLFKNPCPEFSPRSVCIASWKDWAGARARKMFALWTVTHLKVRESLRSKVWPAAVVSALSFEAFKDFSTRGRTPPRHHFLAGRQQSRASPINDWMTYWESDGPFPLAVALAKRIGVKGPQLCPQHIDRTRSSHILGFDRVRFFEGNIRPSFSFIILL